VANPRSLQNLKPIKPGEVRNPNGYSKKRRISDAISAVIEEFGLEREFAITAVAMALGKKHMLKRKVVDPQTKKEVWVEFKPDYAWFAGLREWIEGKVPDDPTSGQDHPLIAKTQALLESMQERHESDRKKAARKAKPKQQGDPPGPGR